MPRLHQSWRRPARHHAGHLSRGSQLLEGKTWEKHGEKTWETLKFSDLSGNFGESSKPQLNSSLPSLAAVVFFGWAVSLGFWEYLYRFPRFETIRHTQSLILFSAKASRKPSCICRYMFIDTYTKYSFVYSEYMHNYLKCRTIKIPDKPLTAHPLEELIKESLPTTVACFMEPSSIHAYYGPPTSDNCKRGDGKLEKKWKESSSVLFAEKCHVGLVCTTSRDPATLFGSLVESRNSPQFPAEFRRSRDRDG